MLNVRKTPKIRINPLKSSYFRRFPVFFMRLRLCLHLTGRPRGARSLPARWPRPRSCQRGGHAPPTAAKAVFFLSRRRSSWRRQPAAVPSRVLQSPRGSVRSSMEEKAAAQLRVLAPLWSGSSRRTLLFSGPAPGNPPGLQRLCERAAPPPSPGTSRTLSWGEAAENLGCNARKWTLRVECFGDSRSTWLLAGKLFIVIEGARAACSRGLVRPHVPLPRHFCAGLCREQARRVGVGTEAGANARVPRRFARSVGQLVRVSCEDRGEF